MNKHVLVRRELERELVFRACMYLGVLTLFFSMILPAMAQTTRDIGGTWQGTIQVGNGTRIVLKISKGSGSEDGGGWRGVFYSIDKEEQGRAIPSITLQGVVLTFAIAAIDGSYVGKVGADAASITGTWKQGNGSYVLNFVRPTDETAWAIPQPATGMAADANPAYEVVTIKPSDPNDGQRGFKTRGRRLIVANETMDDLISFAYGIHAKQIAGGPSWFGTDRYYIEGVPDTAGEPNLKQFRSIIQKLLADRFNLRIHNERRELSAYALTVAKGGVKITKSLGDSNGPPDDEFSTSAWMKETNTTMEEYTKALQYVLDKPVVDQTGLAGRWDFFLQWTPDESQFGGRIPPPAANSNAPPGLFSAIQEQIGLKLELVKAPVEVLVVDHGERPSPN